MPLRTLSVRLAAFYGGAFSCVLLGVGALLYLVVSQKLHHTVDSTIKAEAQMIARVLGTQGEGSGSAERESLASRITALRRTGIERGVMEAGRYIQVRDPAGAILYRSPNLVDRALPLGGKAGSRELPGEALIEDAMLTGAAAEAHPIRVITLPVASNGRLAFLVQVGYYTEDIEWALHELLVSLAMVLPGGLALTCVLGWGVARRALRPVRDVTEAARRIGAGDLDQQITVPASRDEIRLLAETFNDMIGKVGVAFARLRQFARDASHELRTPLNILRGEAEVSLKADREPAEYRRVMASMLEEVEDMSKVVEGLSTLAKWESGEEVPNLRPVSLAALMREAVEDAEVLAEDKGVTVVVSHLDEATVLGDATWLRRLLLNLVDNALKYTLSGGRVTFSLHALEDSAAIAVEDTGVGVSQEELPFIFDRSYRGERSRSRQIRGCGLGLSICKAIAEAHGGSIEAASQLGHGTRITVRLPVSQ